jgi:hypothetical protein
MKVNELLREDKAEDLCIRKLIQDYKEGNGICRFKNMFPQHSIKNGLVYVKKNVRINHCFLDANGELIVPFGICGSLDINAEDLSSFKGFPEILNGTGDYAHYVLQFNGIYKKLTSLEGITKILNGNVYMGGTENLNYSRCSKYINQIDGNLVINGNYKGALLSVLNIKNLHTIWYAISIGSNYDIDNLHNVCEIVNKHLQKDKDILECQEELITNGLKEYAKL